MELYTNSPDYDDVICAESGAHLCDAISLYSFRDGITFFLAKGCVFCS